MTADVSGHLGTVVNDVKQVIASQPPPAGSGSELADNTPVSRKRFADSLIVLGLAVACVVTVMVLQFQSSSSLSWCCLRPTLVVPARWHYYF